MRATPDTLYTTAEIRHIEYAAQSGLPVGTLMQRAGRAAADMALQLIANDAGRMLVLAGPGNNGGDALVVAALCEQHGVAVSVYLASPSATSPEAQAALQQARAAGVAFVTEADVPAGAASWDLVVDGLFGIGLTRALSGTLAQLVAQINQFECPLLALDVPSGLDADTGTVIGPHGSAVKATHTITFIGDKTGLHTGAGRDHAGIVRVATLDIADSLMTPSLAHLNHTGLFADCLRARAHDSHKGSYGDVIVVGGANGMAGAPILAARTAAKAGSGRVFIGFVDTVLPYDSAQPELMCRAAQGLDLDSATLVLGPGLGVTRSAQALLAKALHSSSPLVLDADGLNLLAQEPGLQAALQRRIEPALLTPHPLEAARLLGTDTGHVQGNRIDAARRLAAKYNAVVVLKGSGTVIAAPDGAVVINSTGNPALATAGSGDVLAGLCGALRAQGWPTWQAALGAVWIHGHAADMLVQQGAGPIGLTAGELIPQIRTTLNRLVADRHSF